MMVKWPSESLTVETVIENIGYVARSGSRRGECQIPITFASFL
jgi:hypothetical protein